MPTAVTSFISAEDARRILDAAQLPTPTKSPDPEELATRLDEALRSFAAMTWTERLPASSRSKAAALPLDHFLGSRSGALRGEELAALANQTRERQLSKHSPRRGRPRSEALNAFLGDLAGSYLDVAERMVGTRGANPNKQKQPDGPFVRFVIGVRDVIAQKLEAGALVLGSDELSAAMATELRSLTPGGIRGRLRRLLQPQ